MKQIDRSQIVYQNNHYKPPSDLILRQVPLGDNPCLEMDPTYSTAGVRTFEVCARSENEWQRGLEHESSSGSTKYHRDRHHTKYHKVYRNDHRVFRKKNPNDRYVLVIGKPVPKLSAKTYKRILRKVTDDGTAGDSESTDDQTECTCFGGRSEERNHHHKSTGEPRHKKGSRHRIEDKSLNRIAPERRPQTTAKRRPQTTAKRQTTRDHEELPVVTNHYYFHHFSNLPARNTNPFQSKSSIPVHKIIIQ